MNTKEKILLVQLLLEDLENDCEQNPDKRASKTKSFCEEISNELQNENYLILADFCDTYINVGKRCGDWDGRFFRQTFPMGYRSMEKLHNLKPTYNNKSDEFKSIVMEFVVLPNLLFDDWEI